MARVKVHNLNVHPYSETFKGEDIFIPAGGHIEMDWEEAIDFKKSFGRGVAPIGQDGKPDPRGFKMIKVDAPATPVIADDGLTCHANGKRAASKEELAALLSEFAHMHVKDDEAEKAQGDELATLRKLLETQQAQINALMSEKASEKGPSDDRRKSKA